jgi:hypothetical protein
MSCTLAMSPTLAALALTLCAFGLPAVAENKAPGHYLFAWTGDAAQKGNDFLAVIDADPASATYGKLITTVATDQQTVRIHHTEYVMPASGMLFANDHDERSWVISLWKASRQFTASS